MRKKMDLEKEIRELKKDIKEIETFMKKKSKIHKKINDNVDNLYGGIELFAEAITLIGKRFEEGYNYVDKKLKEDLKKWKIKLKKSKGRKEK